MIFTIVPVSWIAGGLLFGGLTVANVGCQKGYYTDDQKYIGKPERVEGERPRGDRKEDR